MLKTSPSLFPYPGSKWNVMERLIPLLPDHEHYVSVFGGSGAEILAKPPSPRETFNDLDEHIHNVFKVIQVKHLAASLAEQVAIPHSRELYNDALEVIRQPILNPVTSAAAFLIVAYQGLDTGHPLLKRRCSWRILPLARKLRQWLALPTNIHLVADRLRRVQVENRHWHSIITQYDSPTTFFFLDPPYYPGTVTHLYYKTMTQAEHRALLAVIRRIRGRAIICNYANEVYDAALADWYKVEFPMATNLAGERLERTEIVWLNYDPTTTKLWLPK